MRDTIHARHSQNHCYRDKYRRVRFCRSTPVHERYDARETKNHFPRHPREIYNDSRTKGAFNLSSTSCSRYRKDRSMSSFKSTRDFDGRKEEGQRTQPSGRKFGYSGDDYLEKRHRSRDKNHVDEFKDIVICHEDGSQSIEWPVQKKAVGSCIPHSKDIGSDTTKTEQGVGYKSKAPQLFHHCTYEPRHKHNKSNSDYFNQSALTEKHKGKYKTNAFRKETFEQDSGQTSSIHHDKPETSSAVLLQIHKPGSHRRDDHRNLEGKLARNEFDYLMNFSENKKKSKGKKGSAGSVAQEDSESSQLDDGKRGSRSSSSASHDEPRITDSVILTKQAQERRGSADEKQRESIVFEQPSSADTAHYLFKHSDSFNDLVDGMMDGPDHGGQLQMEQVTMKKSTVDPLRMIKLKPLSLSGSYSQHYVSAEKDRKYAERAKEGGMAGTDERIPPVPHDDIFNDPLPPGLPVPLKPIPAFPSPGAQPVPPHPGIMWPVRFASAPPFTTPGYHGGGIKQPTGVVQMVPRSLNAGVVEGIRVKVPTWVSPLYRTYGIGGPFGPFGPFTVPDDKVVVGKKKETGEGKDEEDEQHAGVSFVPPPLPPPRKGVLKRWLDCMRGKSTDPTFPSAPPPLLVTESAGPAAPAESKAAGSTSEESNLKEVRVSLPEESALAGETTAAVPDEPPQAAVPTIPSPDPEQHSQPSPSPTAEAEDADHGQAELRPGSGRLQKSKAGMRSLNVLGAIEEGSAEEGEETGAAPDESTPSPPDEDEPG